MMDKSIVPVEVDKLEPVVDSRIIATEMKVGHKNWVNNTLKKYQKEIEDNFGVLRFKNAKPKKKGGRPERYCMLTEDQAYYALALSRNSRKVVELKAKLVKAFSKCRKQIRYQQMIIDFNRSNPGWLESREQIKESNELLRDAIAAYVQRHSDELSDNRKRFIYNNVNDKLAIALVGCRPAKFKRDRKANTFRDALTKDELKNLEQLEMLVTKLIEQTDLCPLEAVPEAANRLLLKAAS